jgi:GTP-binding protein
VVCVPVGTQVRRLGESALVADFGEGQERAVVARGGLGGRGNRWFARPEWRVPRIAQRGHDGEDVEIELEWKLVADVGIVGLPNVGKSSLLRAMTAARPRVAGYPFTSVEPVLGVAGARFETFVVADMPALVEGAHGGAGLGVEFLRHIERTRLLLHLVDGSRGDPLSDMEVVKRELVQYCAALVERPEVVVVNKIDVPLVEARMAELADTFRRRGIEPQFISAAKRRGTDELLERIADILSREPRETAVEAGRVMRLRGAGRRFEVCREGQGFRVEGERVVTFAEMMPVEVEEGRQELWWRLGRWGVSAALRRAGARAGDRVRLGEVEVEWPG